MSDTQQTDMQVTLDERLRARLAELRQLQSTLQQQLVACGTVIAELEALLKPVEEEKE